MTHRIQPGGVWPKNLVSDLVRIRHEHSIHPSMTIHYRLSLELEEMVPFSNVKWSELLLKNNLVASIIVDPLMPKDQAMLSDGETSILIENIIVEEAE